MNKKGMIVLLILIALSISKGYADYTIECERDCEVYSNISCSNETTTIGTNDSILIPNFDYNNNQTYRIPFMLLGLPEQENTIKCLLELNRTTMANWTESTETNMNLTTQVLNSSDTYYDGAYCSQAGSGEINNEICFDNLTTKNFQYVIYSSTDGSCSGTQLQQNLGDNTGCAYSIALGDSYDIYYYTEHWNYASGVDCWDTNNKKFGNPSTINLFNCELPCESDSQYAVLIQHVENNPASQPAEYVYFNATEKRIDCVEDYDYCALFGEPYNDSLVYGCECLPEQFDYGITCEDDSCERECSGNETELVYINETAVAESQFINVITSGEPTAVAEYFTNELTGFLGLVFPELSSLLWIIVFVVVVFIFVGMILYLFGG